MKPVTIGHVNTEEMATEDKHAASVVVNLGVGVVSTPSLIGFLELASHRAILPFVEEGEVSVGTRVEVDHLAAALVGKPVTATARIESVDRRRITFAVEARQGDKLVMQGRHVRAVVSRERLLARKPDA